jgi:hypothetical protein
MLHRPPPGLIELYFHPVALKEHFFASDLPALLDDDVLSTLARFDRPTAQCIRRCQ